MEWNKETGGNYYVRKKKITNTIILANLSGNVMLYAGGNGGYFNVICGIR